MTAQNERAELFHALHRRGEPLVLFNVWDAGSARAVAEAGAPAIATGSWSVAAANGFSDGESLPLAFSLENLRRIVAAVGSPGQVLPVTIDLESGYAEDAAGVGRTVAGALETGAIGCNLEDSFPADGSLRAMADAAARLAAARDAARAAGIGCFINARTDVFFQKPAVRASGASSTPAPTCSSRNRPTRTMRRWSTTRWSAPAPMPTPAPAACSRPGWPARR